MSLYKFDILISWFQDVLIISGNCILIPLLLLDAIFRQLQYNKKIKI